MSTLDLVKRGLSNWPQPVVAGTTMVVPTHCLYPSRTVVTAFIDSGPSSAVVSDGGGAIGEARYLPSKANSLLAALKKHTREWGVSVGSNGWIYSRSIPIEEVGAMVAVVASASRDAAKALVKQFRPKVNIEEDWTLELSRLLKREFGPNVYRQMKLAGESNTSHRFDFVVRLPNHNRLVIDAVKRDPGSINSAIVHHLDLKQSRPRDVVQRIVYNDSDEWKASELALLEVGATPVAFSKATHVFKKLAA